MLCADEANNKAQPVLRLRNLSFRYSTKKEAVFDGVDLDVYAGQRVLVVGMNGAGKSTMLRTLCGQHIAEWDLFEIATTDARDKPVVVSSKRVRAFRGQINFEDWHTSAACGGARDVAFRDRSHTCRTSPQEICCENGKRSTASDAMSSLRFLASTLRGG